MLAENRFPRQRPDDEATQPQSIEVEIALIGGLLLDPNAIARVRDVLKPEYFYSGAHGLIYRAIATLHDQGNPTDLSSVCNWLHTAKKLEVVGGQAGMARFLDEAVSALNVDYYAELIVDKWLRRRLIAIGQDLKDLGQSDPGSWPEISQKAEAAVYSLLLHSGVKSDLRKFDQIAIERVEHCEALDKQTTPTALSTGYHDLDNLTRGGVKPGKLWITAGRPGMGKSALAVCRACHIAKTHNVPVFIFSMEMDAGEVFDRVWAQESRVPGRIIDGDRPRDGHTWGLLSNGIAKLAGLPIYVDDTPGITIGEIATKSKHLAATVGTPALIVIDYLQIMGGHDEGNLAEMLSNTTRRTKNLAREIGTTIELLSQLNRGLEARPNKRPINSDLKNSGGIEQDADLIMMLYREEYYNPDTPDRGIAEVNITKNRNGATGTVKLLFEGEFTQFKNLRNP